MIKVLNLVIYFVHCRYLVICHPMKAQYISTPGRAKKIIVAVWLVAILLSSVIVPFVSGVSDGKVKYYSNFIFNFLTTGLYSLHNQWYVLVIRYFL